MLLSWAGCTQPQSDHPAICTQPPATLTELQSSRYYWPNLLESCSRHVIDGRYGPFAIGETKVDALRAIEVVGASHVNAVLSSGLLGEFLNVDSDRSALLRDHDGWSVDALGSMCPFDPFYSRVALYFEGERLRRIAHFCLAYELP